MAKLLLSPEEQVDAIRELMGFDPLYGINASTRYHYKNKDAVNARRREQRRAKWSSKS